MAFDAGNYETVPQTSVPAILACTRAVLTAAHGLEHLGGIKALKRTRASAEILQLAFFAAPAVKLENLRRVLDRRVDKCWQSVETRLGCYADLGEFAEDSKEAGRIHAVMFPKGMGFLNAKYTEEWAESEAILARIDSEKLEPGLELFVGAPFLKALRQAHADYGDALGITKIKPVEPEMPNLIEPLREVRTSLMTFVRVLVAAVENEELDGPTVERILAPVVELRAAIRASRRRAAVDAPEPDVSPDPLPPVD